MARNIKTMRIILLMLVLSLFSVPIISAATVYGPDCNAAYCFRTQTTFYDVENDKTNFMYDVPTEWEENYTALEQMILVFDHWELSYTTIEENGSTVFTEVNGNTSNDSWEWAVYIDQDGMWSSTTKTVDQILVSTDVENYAVCLIPYAGGEHQPFSQSVTDYLAEENGEQGIDEFEHDQGVVDNETATGLSSSDVEISLDNVIMMIGNEGEDDSEYELRASMILANNTGNMTDQSGSWWEMNWDDADEDGLFSIGDSYTTRSNNPHAVDYLVSFQLWNYDSNQTTSNHQYNPDTVPRISLWPGKVNQHNENGVWMTDPDGISGGHHYSEYPNDYGGREVEYCQKFWPNTTSVELMPERETITFYTEGNVDPYESTKDVWRCVGATPNSNPPVDGGSSDDSEDLSPDDEGWVITPGFPLVLSLGALSLASIIASKRRFESLE